MQQIGLTNFPKQKCATERGRGRHGRSSKRRRWGEVLLRKGEAWRRWGEVLLRKGEAWRRWREVLLRKGEARRRWGEVLLRKGEARRREDPNASSTLKKRRSTFCEYGYVIFYPFWFSQSSGDKENWVDAPGTKENMRPSPPLEHLSLYTYGESDPDKVKN